MAVKSGLPENTTIPEPDVQQRFQSLSARKLLSVARSSDDMKWAAYVSVSSVKKLIDDENRVVYRFRTLTVKPNTPPNRAHFFSIRARNVNYKGPISLAPAIKVNCTCQRFVFFYEYALWFRGAADLLRCNGEFPVVTNSSLRIGVCKHGVRSLESLLARSL